MFYKLTKIFDKIFVTKHSQIESNGNCDISLYMQILIELAEEHYIY